MASAAEQLAANINFSAIGKAEELKKRIWFTLGALIIYRLGTYIPLPGIDPAAFEALDPQSDVPRGRLATSAGDALERSKSRASRPREYSATRRGPSVQVGRISTLLGRISGRPAGDRRPISPRTDLRDPASGRRKSFPGRNMIFRPHFRE